MVIRHRDDAYRLLNLSVALGWGTTFSIFDVMSEEEWLHTIKAGHGHLVVSGALSGALEGLRRRGATPADVLSFPEYAPGGEVTTEDMSVAAGWLSTGLLEPSDPTREQQMVLRSMQERDWLVDAAHATSLILAIALTASHAEDHDRG